MIAQLRRRSIDPQLRTAALSAGYTDLQANILAARLPAQAANDIVAHVSPTLAQIDPPDRLPDIQIAAARIADFVMDPAQRAIIVSDHDVDGITGHSVLRTAFIEYFGVEARRLGGILSHKRKEGFGVSEALLERMQAQYPPPALCITVDQGSQDEARFAQMRQMGYEIVVTDHHTVHEPPASALACVNPTREDSQFPDKYISGCHVAFLVACAVRRELIARGHLKADAPSLMPLLDMVGASAVADAVSIARSVNNRAVIRQGLALMNRAPRQAWVALRSVLKKEDAFDEKDLAMAIAPRINALSRMGDALPGVKLLRTDNYATALELAAHADRENQARKAVEQQMLDAALVEGARQAQQGHNVIVVHLPQGVSSVHGITASRLVEAFGRPAACLSPKFGHAGILTGSLRSIPGVDIHQALDRAAQIDPQATLAHGGHSGAAGVTLPEANVARFATALDSAVCEQRDLSAAQPVHLSDGELDRAPDASVLAEIEALGPYGREFEAPLFEGEFRIGAVRAVGDGTHLKLVLEAGNGTRTAAIWFRAMRAGEPAPVVTGQRVRALYALAANTFRGERRIDLQVKYAWNLQ
ncbi:MAG: single-stranded-DNA-specific exonuclease RecJ [Rudaea sp.]